MREKQIGLYRYVHLVESWRENGRIKQRIIKNLGHKEQVEAKDRTGWPAPLRGWRGLLTVLHRLMVSGFDRAGRRRLGARTTGSRGPRSCRSRSRPWSCARRFRIAWLRLV